MQSIGGVKNLEAPPNGVRGRIRGKELVTEARRAWPPRRRVEAGGSADYLTEGRGL